MYELLETQALGGNNKLIKLRAPLVASHYRPGQFVILRIHDRGERIPLTVADCDGRAGILTIVFQELGKSTYQLGAMNAGDELLDVVGPLGRPTGIANFGTVICVGGGTGVACTYPVAKALKDAGNRVYAIMGARTKELLFWETKFKALCDEFIITTDDGSYGRKGVVTVPLKECIEREPIARVFATGPTIMMKFVALTTREYETPTIVSLNPIMVDGTGMCGACRCEVGGKTRFVCVDGPEFDGHQVDFELLMSRQRMYIDKEKLALERWQNEQNP